MPPTDPMTPQPCRDPRVDPKPGDVLAKDSRVREVVRVGRLVIVFRFQFGWKEYERLIPNWPIWAHDAEVLHAAE